MENEKHKILMELWYDLKVQKLTEDQFLLKASEHVPLQDVQAFIKERQATVEQEMGREPSV